MVLWRALATLVVVCPLGAAQGLRSGASTFATYCAACHGAGGRGGEKAPALAGTDRITGRTEAELFRVVHDGTADGMPAFAQIGDANIRLLVRYLRGTASATGDISAGRALFFGVAQCSHCHMVHGQGGFIGSNLTGYAAGRTMDAIVNAITAPDPPIAPASQVVRVTTSSGEQITGVLRNQDAFNLELQTVDGRYRFFSRHTLREIHYEDHSLMPRDYGTRLTAKELNDIASFLVAAGRTQ